MNKRLSALALFLLLVPTQASPLKALVFYHGPRLADEAIEYLSNLARDEPKGAEKVRKYISKHRLPVEGDEDALLRIAVRNGVIPEDEAVGMYSRLSGVNGFRSTLSKVIGKNRAKTRGHLNELRIADRASRRDFTVKGIGEKFDDGIRNHSTDIDVVVEKNGAIFALEAKDYAPATRLPMDQFRADMNSLIEYQSQMKPSKIIPVFSLTRTPGNPRDWKVLQNEADKRGIKLIVGPPDEQAVVLNYLEMIS